MHISFNSYSQVIMIFGCNELNKYNYYIRNKNMKIDDIFESPIPDEWDKEMFSRKTTFAKMKKYVLDNAAKLGTGSSRIAVDIPYEGRDTAFKVAINNKGIAQNIEEIALLNDYYVGGLEITIPVIDYDTSDKPKWIHMEKAQKATDSFFIKKYGRPLRELIRFSRKKLNTIQGKRTSSFYDIDGELTEEATLFCDTVVDLCYNSELLIDDLSGVHNWGIYEDRPVIIDLGFTTTTRPLYDKF